MRRSFMCTFHPCAPLQGWPHAWLRITNMLDRALRQMLSLEQGGVAGVVLVTIVLYVPLTIAATEWRGRVRKRMNELDNDLGARATDMLLNYETVRPGSWGQSRTLTMFPSSVSSPLPLLRTLSVAEAGLCPALISAFRRRLEASLWAHEMNVIAETALLRR